LHPSLPAATLRCDNWPVRTTPLTLTILFQNASSFCVRFLLTVLAPEATGLYAISIGLSRSFDDDHEQLRHGMIVYDALYAWCESGDEHT
jgi:Chromate resistance exported protein